jgi:pilus assembly protein CpaB
MDSRRIILALAIALVFTAGATFLLYQGIHNQKAGQAQTTKIVVASKAIDSGSVLGAENIALADWPSNQIIPGSFLKIDEVAGRSVIYPVSEKQPILPSYLASPGSGIGLTVKIPEGMRATSVRSNEVTGVAGFLYPGSHVDVLVTYKIEDGKTQETQTVLQNVEVLTAGQHIEPSPQGKAEIVNVVTLLLTPQDSQKVVLAQQEGSIQFVLRNGADTSKVATTPVGMPDVTARQKKEVVAPVRRVAARLVQPKPENFYEIETIHGDKRNTDKFKVPESN